MTAVLFWDIDGTLLTTGRAGIFAWEDATLEVVGRQVDLASLDTAGLTDVEVGAKILDTLGADPELLARLVRRYEELLPDRLHLRKGQVLPGVVEVLETLRGREDVVNLLLTGNTRAGARAKLTHYGLYDYLSDGAFADGTTCRTDIAECAWALVRDRHQDAVSPDRTYVIGDTPHDIHCGKAIGARTVAVASGIYSASQLQEHEPWRCYERLPAADEFIDQLGLRRG